MKKKRTTAKRKPGRPVTTGTRPIRNVGRWSDRDWNKIKAAARRADVSVAEWARGILLERASNDRGDDE